MVANLSERASNKAKSSKKFHDKSLVPVVDVAVVKSIEEKLFNIFEQNEKLDNPVFHFVKEGVIQKLAYFISGSVNRPVTIGIAGATASGKSTFAVDLIDSINQNADKLRHNTPVTRVNADDYYYDRSEMIEKAGSFENFAKNYDYDVPESIELDLLKKHIEQLILGNDVWLPKYTMDHRAIRYDKHNLVSPTPIIVSEGMFNLRDELNDIFDFTFFVAIDEDVQRKRWYERAEKRKLVGEVADSVYNKAMTRAKTYVNPTISNADFIVNGEASRDDFRNILLKLIEELAN